MDSRVAPLDSDVRRGVADALARAITGEQSALDELTAKHLLSELGIAVPSGVRVPVGTDPGVFCEALAAPFVVKALSPEALHKSDIGAVRLSLPDADAVRMACADIASAMDRAGKPLAGFLLEEMAAPGLELVIGGTTDPQLGPMIMLGSGGIYAEILQDAVFRLCPIDRRDAAEMIDDLRMAPMLNGARGRPPVDLEAVMAILIALGGADGFFMNWRDAVTEFDLNPVFARPDGVVAVDCRIVLAGNRS